MTSVPASKHHRDDAPGANRSNPPPPNSAAPAKPHNAPRATARSRQMTVPIKPSVISIPCDAGRRPPANGGISNNSNAAAKPASRHSAASTTHTALSHMLVRLTRRSPFVDDPVSAGSVSSSSASRRLFTIKAPDDLQFPCLGASLPITDFELARRAFLKLRQQRKRIVWRDQHDAKAGKRSVEGTEYTGVPDSVRYGARVQFGQVRGIGVLATA